MVGGWHARKFRTDRRKWGKLAQGLSRGKHDPGFRHRRIADQGGAGRFGFLVGNILIAVQARVIQQALAALQPVLKVLHPFKQPRRALSKRAFEFFKRGNGRFDSLEFCFPRFKAGKQAACVPSLLIWNFTARR